MKRPSRRVVGYVGGFLAIITTYTLAFQWVMATFEGRQFTLLESLAFVVETFTTVGYGTIGGWTHPASLVLVIAMMVTGVFFVFMALPLFIVPWMESRLERSPPDDAGNASGHVVVATYSNRVATLIEELAATDLDYVLLEPDEQRARDLDAAGHTVVHGDPESEEGLLAANVDRARTLVCAVDDEVNASIALATRQIADSVQLLTFAEDPELAEYHRFAGADEVFTPRKLVGESLANKVTAGVSTDVADAVEVAPDFEIAELPVQGGSPLDGRTVGHSGIRERTGANIVGAWFRGEFVTPPDPDAVIDDRTVLLVAGREHQLEQLKGLTLSETRRSRHGAVIVCGHGEVGSTVAQAVTGAGLPCTTVDVEERQGVDVVGDATDVETLEAAGIEDAASVILTVSDDTTAVFAALVIREIDADVEVIARATESGSVRKLYRAGADYVLGLPTVSGRMVASRILGEDVISFDQQVEVVRIAAGRLAGSNLREADLPDRFQCTVIAVERGDAVLTDLGPELLVEPEDDLVVAGPDEGLNELAAWLGD